MFYFRQAQRLTELYRNCVKRTRERERERESLHKIAVHGSSSKILNYVLPERTCALGNAIISSVSWFNICRRYGCPAFLLHSTTHTRQIHFPSSAVVIVIVPSPFGFPADFSNVSRSQQNSSLSLSMTEPLLLLNQDRRGDPLSPCPSASRPFLLPCNHIRGV